MFPSLSALKNSPFLPKSQKVKNGEFQLTLSSSQQEITYQLVVSNRRKSISLELKHSAIKVRCPQWLTHTDVEQFILSKQQWLLSKLSVQQANKPVSPRYTSGHVLLFKGEQYTLEVKHNKRHSISIDQNSRTLTLSVPSQVKNTEAYIKRKLIEFYYRQAEQYIPKRTAELEIHTNAKAKAVELKVYKRRWGCCYSSGLIRINPMLMGAPDWVIDCVIIHELSHLTHMNHSRDFWQLNEQHCSHCKASKRWLKENGRYLQIV